MGTSGLSSNPIHCLRCNLEVPPERLDLSDRDIQAITHWHSIESAIGWLELDSGAYEEWARAQLLDPLSSVNVEGLEAVKEINRPEQRWYYWFFQPEEDDDFEPRTTCPICDGPLTQYDSGIFPQRLCDKDSVVVSASD
jgi:predicted  nucleic acid-binding Zn ribbon protein